MSTAQRPEEGEYAPYYGRYISLVPDGDVLDVLRRQGEETLALLQRNAGQAGHSYAPGKWTVAEAVGHMTDSERVFSYRAMRFSRGDQTELPGYDQDAFVANGGFRDRRFEDLLAELAAVRQATIAFARGLPAEALGRRGIANGKEVSARALLYISAGHELHHVGILRDRYGLA